MIIKDILQQLIDDGLVNVEKCGSINFYWSFKFDKFKTLSNQVTKLQESINSKKDKILELTKSIELLKNERVEENNGKINRTKMLKKLNDLNQDKIELIESLNSISDKDSINPESIDNLKKLSVANEFMAETIESLIYYFKKTGVDDISLRKEFGIPLEFESFEVPNFI